jgi:hypothetical protein
MAISSRLRNCQSVREWLGREGNVSWDGPLSQGKQQEPTAEVLEQAAEPPSPGSVQAVAACGHGPSAGAVSSFKLEACRACHC